MRVALQDEAWRGMEAWRITGEGLSIVLTRIGGHLAAIQQPGEELNPLWQPGWPAAEPGNAASQDSWGAGPEAPLLACIVGHNLCIDRFGAPWPGEERPLHGEAGVLPWAITRSDRGCVLQVRLPEAGLRLRRAFSLEGDELAVETTVQHDAVAERRIEWAEHVTVGDPFLDGATITAGIDGAWTWPEDLGPAARWHEPCAAVDPQAALAMPPASLDAALGDIVTARVAEGWWRMHRPDLDRTLEYRWEPRDWPWLCLWSEHRSRPQAPWNGRERARGMEFATKPFPEGAPPPERAESWQGRSTICRVPPGAGLSRTFTVRWS